MEHVKFRQDAMYHDDLDSKFHRHYYKTNIKTCRVSSTILKIEVEGDSFEFTSNTRVFVGQPLNSYYFKVQALKVGGNGVIKRNGVIKIVERTTDTEPVWTKYSLKVV